MKLTTARRLGPLLCMVLFAAAAPRAATPPAGSSDEEASYAAGLTAGAQLHAIGVGKELSVDAYARGLREGLGGHPATAADQQKVREFILGVRDAAAKANTAAATDFLARNGKQKDVHTTASGLQYRIVAAGPADGAAPQPTDQVTVNYRGRLLDGTEFDSSYASGRPVTLAVNGVIKGWQEALVLMKPGAKWVLWVPPTLAYGADSRPPIPPGSLLVFDVELLTVGAPRPEGSPPQAP